MLGRMQTYEQRSRLPAAAASRSQSHATHATNNAARFNHLQANLQSPSASRCARIGRFWSSQLSNIPVQVCPVERPERCSIFLCPLQRSTSARHANSGAQFAAHRQQQQLHIPANTDDMKQGLCTPRRSLAVFAFPSILQSWYRGQLPRPDDTTAP